MQVFKWPLSKERQVYEKILNDEKFRKVLNSVLNEISERAEKRENLTFKPSEIATKTGDDVTKVDVTNKVKEATLSENVPKESKKRETLSPQYILKEVEGQGLNYMRLKYGRGTFTKEGSLSAARRYF